MSFKKLYFSLTEFASSLKSPLLLAIRLFWGGAFLITGWGKLGHLAHVTDYFYSLGIPFPAFSAMLTASVETICGTCLVLGLFSRLITIPLMCTMVAALLITEKMVLKQIFSDPQQFIHTAPFSFLFASLIVFVFGPGSWSVDYWLWKKKS